MINNFNLNIFKFNLVTKETIQLHEYKGSALRGGFGIAFRKLCCIQKNIPCRECALKNSCVYSIVFEGMAKDGLNNYRLEEIPKPFIIEPPMDKKTEYLPEETISFNFILIGKAITFLPYVIFAFSELGKIGLGKTNGKYELKEVLTSDGEIIFDSKNKILKNVFTQYTDNGDNRNINGKVKISYITPTRLKSKGKYIRIPEFEVVIRALLRRITILSDLYCDYKIVVNYDELIKIASEVKIKNKNLYWYDWERYSKYRDLRMSLGGFVGEVEYEGNIAPFKEFLCLGEKIHIGKNCTFGLGKYEIQN
ncbi:MAG: CRISPR system precrRNA processing endoribonuclease RAMP protein Cas6 [Endomicrobiia bacterium]